MSSFFSSLSILETSLLSDVVLVKIFSNSIDCCLVLLAMSFALQKVFSFMRSNLLIVTLRVCATDALFRKLSPVPMCSRLFPTSSSIRFSVTGFYDVAGRYGPVCILLHANIQLSSTFCGKGFLPLYNFDFFVKNKMFRGVWIYVLVFDLILLVCQEEKLKKPPQLIDIYRDFQTR